jgi:hypothetical protein
MFTVFLGYDMAKNPIIREIEEKKAELEALQRTALDLEKEARRNQRKIASTVESLRNLQKMAGDPSLSQVINSILPDTVKISVSSTPERLKPQAYKCYLKPQYRGLPLYKAVLCVLTEEANTIAPQFLRPSQVADRLVVDPEKGFYLHDAVASALRRYSPEFWERKGGRGEYLYAIAKDDASEAIAGRSPRALIEKKFGKKPIWKIVVKLLRSHATLSLDEIVDKTICEDSTDGERLRLRQTIATELWRSTGKYWYRNEEKRYFLSGSSMTRD